jgi:hypothetical protein
MIKELQIEIKGHRTNITHFRNLNYRIEFKKPIMVLVEDLMPGSTSIITTICDSCGSEKSSEFRFYWEYTNGLKSKYYCNKCNSIKRKKTCLKKWGVDNPMKSEEIKHRLKRSLEKKYGVDSFSKTEEFKEKYKSTCLEKWGVDNSFQSEIIKSKIREKNMENLGVYFPQQNEYVRSKTTESFLKKFGTERYSQTEECKMRIKTTSLKKWGVDNFSKTDDFKWKVRKTSQKNWGVSNFTKTEEFKNASRIKREGLTKLKYEKIIGTDFQLLEYEGSNFKIFHRECQSEFHISRDLLYQRNNLGVCICTNCLEISAGYSNMELEMQDFLNSLGIRYIIKDRKILNGRELDIYIPEFKLAIEMNGLYWHSEIYLERTYHREKTLSCKAAGIDLLHIWEDDWKYKRPIIKSIILNRLNLSPKRVSARKCQIKIVTSKEASYFLEENHIQGSCGSKIKLGLYSGSELISLMTFGLRYTNGKKEWELIRFCNKINLNIVGGASKLFTRFLLDFDDEIVSYADISLFSGELYNKLGFKKVSFSEPNYFWVVDGIRKHRFNYNKKRLVRLGHDQNKSETEIMHSLGHYRVFSCGQEKWLFKKT